LDISREHNHATYSKDGSFYSLKVVKGNNATEKIIWPSGGYSNPEWYQRFAGRTVTLGCWVYSVSAADNVSLAFSDGTWRYLGSSAPADTWTWMEHTYTISASTTVFLAAIIFDGDASDVAYISQPMLVFGKSIGEGNYTRPQGEVVNCEAKINIISNGSPVPADDEILNLEVLSEGKFPKGAKGIDMEVSVKNSAVTDSQGLYFGGTSGYGNALTLYPQVANFRETASGYTSCDTNGDIYQTTSEADSTLSSCYLYINAVHLH